LFPPDATQHLHGVAGGGGPSPCPAIAWRMAVSAWRFL
jgi:hypothetical protein